MEFDQAIKQLSLVYPQLTICVFADREKERSCYERWRKLDVTRDNDELLPINPELINDWLFCHNHDHDAGYEEQCPENTITTLTNMKQVNKLLIQSDADHPDQYIFESQDGEVSVYVSVQNSSWYFCQEIDTKLECKKVPLNLIKSSYVHFKVYRSMDTTCTIKEELSDLRLSFSVDWFKTTNQVMVELIDTLEKSNQRLQTPGGKASTFRLVGDKHENPIELNCGFISREDIKGMNKVNEPSCIIKTYDHN